ncbi:DUF4097 domain-containing protein [Candidatus Omnitrophota bacterium]
MKTLKVLLTLLLILIGVFTEQSIANSSRNNAKKWIGAVPVTEQIDISVAGKPGMEIILEHSFGNIEIIKGRDDAIHISGEKTVTAKDDAVIKEFLSLMNLEVSDRPNRVKIVTEYPDNDLKKKVKSFTISYTIEIPSDVILSVENSFGSIDITGVSGEFDITNGYGKVTAAMLDGRTSLTNKFGAIKARQITGEAVITTAHSSLDIEQITGNLTAQTKFGKLTVNTVKGNGYITGGHGGVECTSISGDTEITNSHGSVICSAIGGNVRINNSHGRIDVKNMDSDVWAQTSFARVYAENVKGKLTVENQHGAVEAVFIDGGADIHTTFGSVQVDQIDGDVLVTNQHGSITAQNILLDTAGSKRNVRLKTSHASIKLRVPETFSANISASTTFGKFKCDFPLSMNLGDSELSGSNQRLKGTVGDGNDTVELEATHSNIYVEKM